MGYNTPESFVAVKNNERSYFQPKRVESIIDTVVEDLVALCKSIEKFNDDYGELCSIYNSYDWTTTAESISITTTNIKSKAQEYGKRMLQDVADRCSKVASQNTRFADAAENINSNLSNNFSLIESIGR